jgi:hypothetical protein
VFRGVRDVSISVIVDFELSAHAVVLPLLSTLSQTICSNQSFLRAEASHRRPPVSSSSSFCAAHKNPSQKPCFLVRV